MSLNGLDAPHVLDAYQTAVAESAGWFLLKYTSRDAVDLLAHGKNGVVEARDAIKAYTDPSPLYGLIIYRRRKILIKYLPAGTSRLLQARTTVHFQTVLERYSPYETVLEIASADALNDTSLAASFQLHTASPSPSANRLDEIREDGEDSGPGAMRQSPMARSSSGNLSAAQRYKAERRIEQLKRKAELSEAPTSPLQAEDTARALPQDQAPPPPPPPPKSKPSMSQYLVHEEQGQTSITRLESPLSTRSTMEDGVSVASTKSADSAARIANTLDSASQTTLDAAESPKVIGTPTSPDAVQLRDSTAASPGDRELADLPSAPHLSFDKGVSGMGDLPSQSSLDDPYDLSKYDEWFKPKVKLGPRPVNPSENKNRSTGARVSELPANFKPAAKKQEPPRPPSYMPKSIAPTAPAAAAPTPAAAPLLASFNYAPPPIPEIPEYDPRPVSRGSVKSTPSHKSTMMTPDKLRLMKAIEHRKKQMRKSREQQSVKPPTPDEVPEVPQIPPQNIPQQATDVEAEQATGNNSQPQSNKADSGIELHYEKAAQHEEGSERPSNELSSLPPQSGTTAAPSQDSTGDSAFQPNDDDLHRQEEPPAEEESTGTQQDTSKVLEDQTSTQNYETTEHNRSEVTVVPTIVMADGSRPLTSEGLSQGTEDDPTSDVEEDRIILIDDDDSASDTLEASTSPRRQNSDLAKRRRGFVEPLHIEVSSGNPDDFASDDDEFLDELHSATVLQAKPIMVSRSPISNTFSGRRPSADTVTSVRSVNITRTAQADKSIATPDGASLEPTKSQGSSTTITPPLEKNDSLAAMSRTVSSGISRRIQLLAADMTNRDGNHGGINLQARPLTPESPNAFIQQDQRGKKSSAPRGRPTSFRRHSSHRSAQSTATPTPTNENAPVYSVQHDPATNRNSVSVTARIVRPNVIDESNDEGEDFLLESNASINGRLDSAVDELPPLNTNVSQSNVSSPAMSPATSRRSADIRTLHSATSRLGRHRQNSSSVTDDLPHAPEGSVDENAAPKEGGRTTRFLKRISTFGGKRRRGGSQSTPSNASISSLATINGAEENSGVMNNNQKASQRMSMAPDTPPAVVVGDLNVQFPDSLLWKRRIVTIDEAGNLQFAIAHAMEIHKGVAQKRYPLTDFCAPYAPDLDSQELAHSVVLELHDGTALQAACEDAMTQRQVLHLLRTYWKAYTG